MSSSTETQPFWESPDIVARFAARDPDLRLQELAGRYAHPGNVRVLDLGCAAGRNTIFLLERGFDVHAIDSSKAMVKETRRRAAPWIPSDQAGDRIRRGAMDTLDFPDGFFDLIVALGIYQSSESGEAWRRALAESARVLAHGGLVLVANFTDAMDPSGEGLSPVAGEPHVYDGVGGGRGYLVSADLLDRDFHRHGFRNWTPTRTVSREMENLGRRVTANAVYVKP